MTPLKKEEEEEEEEESFFYYSLYKCVFTLQYEPYYRTRDE